MRISKDTLKGYILEEVLAYLIKNTGYKLLVDPIQDPHGLDWRGNGLVVKGRGSVHQVDVLGQLEWIPAFTFPVRLFLEAKFRSGRVGIGNVRNAIGVVQDINQNNFPSREENAVQPRYSYAYALFSTSGFSGPAIDMAIAHQISLVDLSGSEFTDLRDAIDGGAANILRGRESNFEGPDQPEQEINGRSRLVASVRSSLRRTLETQPTKLPHQGYDDFRQPLDIVTQASKRHGELFVGMANGPYMLLLKAENPQLFLRYVERRATHRVTIHWSSQLNEGREWIIRPADGPDAYKLSFTLPRQLAEWVFGEPSQARVKALAVKGMFFSDITLYRKTDTADQLIRLQFDPEEWSERADSDVGRGD